MLAKTVPTAWNEGHDLTLQGSDYIRWDPEEYYEYEDNKPPECLDRVFSTTQITKDMMDVAKLYKKDLGNMVALRFGLAFTEFQTMNNYADIVATPQTTVVQETASPERVIQEAILLPKTRLAVLTANTRVPIQDSAHRNPHV
ncbi:hypothetical protein ETB97_003271 [Aspergillus alliaceus]|uniref:Uncharacterized protein n=1 Tax=Petromyces alliaceus TaxID=209559 RepID=A0A8H6A3C5_PETAA|nr:hypothetical protein ETB97_003271 [Aspergillus burnettii]